MPDLVAIAAGRLADLSTQARRHLRPSVELLAMLDEDDLMLLELVVERAMGRKPRPATRIVVADERRPLGSAQFDVLATLRDGGRAGVTVSVVALDLGISVTQASAVVHKLREYRYAVPIGRIRRCGGTRWRATPTGLVRLAEEVSARSAGDAPERRSA